MEAGSYSLQSKLRSTEFQTIPTAKSAGNLDITALFESPEKIKPAPVQVPDFRQNVILNIHGHSHARFGLSHIGRIPILNPGALLHGRYALLTLRESLSSIFKGKKTWAIDDISFKSL